MVTDSGLYGAHAFDVTGAADVVNALGRVVARAVPGEALSVTSWAPGVYVVMATEPQRFVVAR